MVQGDYKGGGPAMADLVAGRVQLMFETIPNSISYIQSGQLRALAITVDERSKQLPDVPTMSEAGGKDYVSRGWLGVAAPAGTPHPLHGNARTGPAQAVAQPAGTKAAHPPSLQEPTT